MGRGGGGRSGNVEVLIQCVICKVIITIRAEKKHKAGQHDQLPVHVYFIIGYWYPNKRTTRLRRVGQTSQNNSIANYTC